VARPREFVRSEYAEREDLANSLRGLQWLSGLRVRSEKKSAADRSTTCFAEISRTVTGRFLASENQLKA
jgi:hypothetical protein